MLSATATATATTQSKSTQKLLPADVRWCLDNKDDLSLVSYVDHFTLASRRYAVRRYKHIIKRNIPKEDRRRLLSELKFFTKTVRYYQYWYDIMQKKVALKAKLRSTRILDASTKQQAKSLLTTFRGKSSTTSSSSSSNHITTDDDDDDEGDAVDVDLTTEDSLQDASSVDENHATSSSPPQAPSSSGTYSSQDAVKLAY